MQHKISKKHVEVLVAYTMIEMWEVIKKTNKAEQSIGAADADYIAFIRIGRKDENGRRMPGIITHIAKVKNISICKPAIDNFKEAPELAEIYERKGWSGDKKEYQLEGLDELKTPILHKSGDHARSQVSFYTTMDELKKAKFISDMKTFSELERAKKGLK